MSDTDGHCGIVLWKTLLANSTKDILLFLLFKKILFLFRWQCSCPWGWIMAAVANHWDCRSVTGTQIGQWDLREECLQGRLLGMIFLQQYARTLRKTSSSWSLLTRMLSYEQVMLLLHLGRWKERPRKAQKFQTTALLPEIQWINLFFLYLTDNSTLTKNKNWYNFQECFSEGVLHPKMVYDQMTLQTIVY